MPPVERLQRAADRAMFDALTDTDRYVSDTVSQELRATILNHTLQGQTIRLAQLEGRMLELSACGGR